MPARQARPANRDGSDLRLERATSGVTGLFPEYDDRRRWTRYRSIHAGLRALTSDLWMIGEDRFRSFAALLLPRRCVEIRPSLTDAWDAGTPSVRWLL